MSITATDIMQGDFADDRGCRGRDPYCANYPPPAGSYEAYAPSLCGDCADYEAAMADRDGDDADQ